MFEGIKRFFGRKSSPAPTVAWEKPSAVSSPPARGNATPPPPPLASSRLQEPTVATRSRSAAMMGPASAESALAAKRQQTAAATPPPPPAAPATDNRRVVKSYQKGERTSAKDFMNVASAGGGRNLLKAKAKEVRVKTRGGMEDGINLLHRSGSITELHLDANQPSVASAKHHSATTGKTSELRAKDMRGPAQRHLDKIARRRDNR